MLSPEKKYQILFESSKDGIIRTSIEGEIIQANPAFVQMLGHANEQDVLGSYKRHTPREWHPIEDNVIINQLKDRSYSDEYEKEYVRKDGSRFPVSLRLWRFDLPDGTPEVWGIVRDISHQKEAEKKLSMALEMMKKLNVHEVEAREKERKTIALAIHDEIGQAMTALKFDIQAILSNPACKASCSDKLQDLIGITDSVIREAQRISSELRPGVLDTLGLKAALEWYASEWSNRTGIGLQLSVDEFFINKDVELAMFRIVQEGLTNVARHSKAKQARVKLMHNKESIHLYIEDNGVGFAREKIDHHTSFGLIGMRERAEMCGGELRVETDNGTAIHVVIEFDKQRALR